jgi:hypothetical protein
MCMNCGCGLPHEEHGKAANITAKELEAAGAANGQSLRESAQHIMETVELLLADRQGDAGLAKPAGPAGASTEPARGTPGSES